MVKRFSEAEKQTIWDIREAGVPVKRIARHLGRQNVSLRKFIADAGGKRPTPRERSMLRLSLAEREEISAVWPRGGRSEPLQPNWVEHPPRCVGRSMPTVAQRGIGPCQPIGRPSAGHCDRRGPRWPAVLACAGLSSPARGQLVTPTDLFVVG